MRAGAVQLTSSADFDRNVETADRLTRAAAQDGAELVVLPEKWSGYGSAETMSAAADRAPEAIAWAQRTAKELGIDLVAGSIATHGDADRIRNTSLHVGPDGEVKASYVKMHLFDVEVGGREYRESATDEPGDTPVLTHARGADIGLTVCYDLRFPGLFEALDAHVFTLPSAFTLATTRDHWDVLVRARAIEQQAFIVAPNQAGEHDNGMRSGGRSMIVDPWGVVLAQAGEEGETHLTADLDLDELHAIRKKLPALANRRPEVHA
ncbi:MAG: FIG003879: Predicted amidohydrolase; Nit [uncultured Solirubrobacteraceae bacterium]|uniref:FIG003879: Predicted amidohydrolase Nit n=1 Tax=uncultured Solirubrobacteraceae bacterium TaxID=1162706 RepID=A0A6J4S3W6_9ACTN|nr:MAG: FIG003879: Predicted amidohydrolase; Nit [uncultured Solirubrobacteraceae bacterium]